jgi:hypothetical protein
MFGPNPQPRWLILARLPFSQAPSVWMLAVSFLAAPVWGQNQPRPNPRAFSNSVILGGQAFAPTMQRLHVVRTYSLASVRSNPQIMLGQERLDFTPLLTNARSLPNLAERLHALPEHIQIQQETSEITEVDQGLVLHNVLTYRILPGKCADPTAVAQLASAGVTCFTRASVSQRIQEFSQPNDPHYVADSGKRQQAIAAYQRVSAQQQAQADQSIAQLRKMLADPTQRAAIAAQVGPEEAARLQTLNETQLEDEVIDASVQRFEEVAFVPRLESGNYQHGPFTFRAAPSGAEVAAGQQLLRGGLSQPNPSFPRLLRFIPPNGYRNLGSTGAPGGDQVSDLDLGTYIYLTGFTLGHDYEWSREISTTINWCIVGCSSTYDLKVYAGFNYGFGLRFPIQTTLKYHNVVHPNQSAEATTTATFQPINGSVEDFESTGLSSDQLFNGQEIVAQVGADAGFSFSLPVIGNGGESWQVGVDFTQMLPAPYTGGHFQPPAPGSGGINSQFTFDTLDLLGGLLNYGVVGGQVFPAVKVNLHSDKLQFTLKDEVANRPTLVTATGQSVTVGVNTTSLHDSHFSFGNPVYNLGFTVTPGIDARLFIDLAVWSDHWDWPIWFPQLAVTLPPNGIDFGCHAGTTCVLDFQPEHQAAITNGILQQLTGMGCRQQLNAMSCPTYRAYQACLAALKSHPLGLESCDPGMGEKQGEAADRTLTQGGCLRNGPMGNYLCTMQNGMLGLCNTMLTNGAVLSCNVLVPPSTDQILRRGGCMPYGHPGDYSCPKPMMGLCQLFVKNRVILACTQH